MTNKAALDETASTDPRTAAEPPETVEQKIEEARSRGRLATLGQYVKLSGPGWLQSAITLGGGSLANALYLGVLGGFAFLWLQPLAMIMGVIMLSAIGYVTLSAEEKPFQLIRKHINPVLGWGWIIATLMANCVWSLPQFNLATAATRQNLMPGIFGEGIMADGTAQTVIGLSIAVICTAFVWSYDSGSKGVKAFDILLKAVVGLIVVSFFGVVVKMSGSDAGVPWREVLAGLRPNLSLLTRPAGTFAEHLAPIAEPFRNYWEQSIVNQQRDVMIGAAATAVGINMTFLLPYSMLKRGWNKTFRGLAIFDLSTGLFIPFILVTGCVVIVSASRFHAQPAPGLLAEAAEAETARADPGLLAQYRGLLKNRVAAFSDAAPGAEEMDAACEALPLAERRLAAMLVKRDSNQLAQALTPLTGSVFANYVFGFGVVGMAVSSIIILMLINGFVICEIMERPLHGWTYKLGALIPLIGILGPFVWGAAKARFWLAVPTSVFGMVLLPVAYWTFFLMMNERRLLKGAMPTGGKRLAWNVLMIVAAGLATFGSLWSLWSKRTLKFGQAPVGTIALVLVAVYVLAVVVVQLRRGTTVRQSDA